MLRFNLSKGGIGISGGVKGFRIGTGPRGTYVHAGRGGLYYREYLFRHGPRGSRPATRPSPLPFTGNQEGDATFIESAPASEINDIDADGLLQEIRAKRATVPIFPFAVLAWLAIGFVALTHGVISFGLLSLSSVILLAAYIFDAQRKTAVVMYDLDDDAEACFRAVYDACMELRSCAAIWSVMSTERTRDYKRNAGAANLIQRKRAVVGDARIPFLKTNVSVPSIVLHHDTLYFLPDRVLITNRAGVGAVNYPDFLATSRTGRFIEEGPVPRDSTQVDQTWRFVNKNGGPDRRFNNNRLLPILAYQDVLFASATGIRAYLQVSKRGGADALLASLERQRRQSATSPPDGSRPRLSPR